MVNVLERTRDRIFKYLRRRGFLTDAEFTEDPHGERRWPQTDGPGLNDHA